MRQWNTGTRLFVHNVKKFSGYYFEKRFLNRCDTRFFLIYVHVLGYQQDMQLVPIKKNDRLAVPGLIYITVFDQFLYQKYKRIITFRNSIFWRPLSFQTDKLNVSKEMSYIENLYILTEI